MKIIISNRSGIKGVLLSGENVHNRRVSISPIEEEKLRNEYPEATDLYLSHTVRYVRHSTDPNGVRLNFSYVAIKNS